MEREHFAFENENLRKHAAQEHSFRSIEITESLMERIRNQESKRPMSGFKPLRRTALLTALISLILLASVTVYAANEYLQIRNKSGQVVLETYYYPDYTNAEMQNLLGTYRNRVLDSIQPGEEAAYYVDDDALNNYDSLNKLKFEYKPVQYKDYKEFIKERDRISAPKLNQPDYIPKGFTFLYGQIDPRVPMHGDGDNSEYSKLMELLVNRANKSTSQDKLFIEPIEVKQAIGAVLYYSSGEGKIDFSIQATYGTKLSLLQDEDIKSEKVMIKGQEAIYQKRTDNEDLIAWYDNSSSVAYVINDNSDGELTRKDFIRMAESMITE